MFSLLIYIIIAAVGFMMVFVYKQTNTTARILKPDPEKIKKLFLIVFGIAAVVTFALSWFTTYELQASNIPLEGSIKYQNMKSVMIFVMNFSFLAMIILANTYSLTLKKLAAWPYLLAIGFYAAFYFKGCLYHFRLFFFVAKIFKATKRRPARFSQRCLG